MDGEELTSDALKREAQLRKILELCDRYGPDVVRAETVTPLAAWYALDCTRDIEGVPRKISDSERKLIRDVVSQFPEHAEQDVDALSISTEEHLQSVRDFLYQRADGDALKPEYVAPLVARYVLSVEGALSEEQRDLAMTVLAALPRS